MFLQDFFRRWDKKKVYQLVDPALFTGLKLVEKLNIIILNLFTQLLFGCGEDCVGGYAEFLEADLVGGRGAE